MYYDQLKAYHHELEELLKLVISDPSITEDNKEKQITMILSRLKKLNKKMDALKKEIGYYSSTDSYEAKRFKKEVKHEFLTQAKNGYPINSIITYIKENFDNPGVNIEKFVASLRSKDDLERYFAYENVTRENSSIWLTEKAERYLENEANVSLRK